MRSLYERTYSPPWPPYFSIRPRETFPSQILRPSSVASFSFFFLSFHSCLSRAFPSPTHSARLLFRPSLPLSLSPFLATETIKDLRQKGRWGRRDNEAKRSLDFLIRLFLATRWDRPAELLLQMCALSLSRGGKEGRKEDTLLIPSLHPSFLCSLGGHDIMSPLIADTNRMAA